MVDIEVRERAMPSFEIISNQGVEEMDVNIKDMLSGMFGQQKKKRKMTVADAFEYLIQEEENKLLDMDQVTRIAVERAEQMGIIFIDEIDKVAGRESGHGPDVVARRRATRHSADHRRHHRQHALRHDSHRPHFVYRGRRVSRDQAFGPHSRTARTPADSRGAAIAEGRGFHPHFDGAEERADQAVRGAAGNRRREAQHSRTTRSRRSRALPPA